MGHSSITTTQRYVSITNKTLMSFKAPNCLGNEELNRGHNGKILGNEELNSRHNGKVLGNEEFNHEHNVDFLDIARARPQKWTHFKVHTVATTDRDRLLNTLNVRLDKLGLKMTTELVFRDPFMKAFNSPQNSSEEIQELPNTRVKELARFRQLIKSGERPPLMVQKIDSCKGLGVVASEDIAPWTLLCEYLGDVMTTEEVQELEDKD